jgi:putative transcription factor
MFITTEDHRPIILNKPVNKKVHKHVEIDKVQKFEKETEILKHDNVGASIGRQIQQARIASGFTTQKSFANALNILPNLVNDYESGRAIPDPKILQKMRTLTNTKFK